MSDPKHPEPLPVDAAPAAEASETDIPAPKRPRLEPTRYGDWELNGKCVDF